MPWIRPARSLTAARKQHLAVAAQAVWDRLADWLADWDDRDIAVLAQLAGPLNQSTDRP